MPGPVPMLCENCGYDVDSLVARLASEPDLKCPECATPVAESMPERRTGTPWQIQPSLSSWWRTNIATLNRPRRHNDARVQGLRLRAAALLFINCAVSILLVTLSTKLTAIADQPWWQARPRLSDVGPVLSGIGIAFGVIGSFTLAHVFVVWLVRWRRGDPGAGARAWTIVGHASAAWLLLPILAAPLEALSSRPRYAFVPAAEVVYSVAGAAFTLAFLVLPLGIFEVATISGLRATRFTNPPRTPAP